MSRIKNSINQDKLFVANAIVKVPRSILPMNQKVSTTFNAGKLVPITAPIEVIPGDTMTINLDSVIRTTSPFIKAPMDDLRMDFYAFFVPDRIVWSNFSKMIANYQDDPDWTQDVNLITPLITWNSDEKGSVEDKIDTIADHFGIPPLADNWEGGIDSKERTMLNAIPFRAYCAVWNEWFRDENLQSTIYIDKDTADVSYFANASETYITSAINGGQMLPLNKIKDYFTTCLPAPQAGAAATINIGGSAPLVFDDSGVPIFAGNNGNIKFGSFNAAIDTSGLEGLETPIKFKYEGNVNNDEAFKTYESNNSQSVIRSANTNKGIIGFERYQSGSYLQLGALNDSPIEFNNITADINSAHGYADLSNISGISVNDLRYLIQIQQIKELDARYGRRYKEYLMGHWGVISADARLQIPEFLGHTGYDLNINQTVQTSGTVIEDEQNPATIATTPQSNISSYSLTSGSGLVCNKSFTEHGYIVIVGGVRVKHRTYTQGINRMWFRRSRFDFYDPTLANIGEQPVYNAEIYVEAGETANIFGYQEAWASYRYTPNICSGYQRPQVPATLAYWNFADNYTQQPTLSGEWIQEDISSIDRCLAISSEVVPQFTADFFIRNKAIRPMPVHSIPGLLDHSGKIII